MFLIEMATINFLKIFLGVIVLSAFFFLIFPSIAVFSVTLAEDDLVAQPLYFASSIKTWDFSNASDYIYDQTKIEVLGGEARLRVTPPADWYNPAWFYRRLVTIDNSSSDQDFNNFQIEIKLDSSNFDFTKARSDGADIRFTMSDGITPLDYWLEHYNPVDQEAFLFVEVSFLPAFESESIYIYYGNPQAGSGSNWNNAFMTGPAGPQITSVFTGGFNAFPGLERLSSGELLVSFRSGIAHVSPDGGVMLGRSVDDGNNWIFSVLFNDPLIDDRVDLGLTKLTDGTLIQPFYQHSGTTTVAAYIIKSTNGGQTWGSPINIKSGALNNWSWLATYGQIIELPDGMLLMPVYGIYDNQERMQSLLLQSIDQGETWSLKSVIASGETNYNETSILRLDEQNYLAVVRREDNPTHLYEVVSNDGGDTWNEPVYLFDGTAPNLVQLWSGNILLATSDRYGVKGIRLLVSKDLGETWSDSVLFDQEYVISDLGYPATFELRRRPSAIMTVYYKEDQGLKSAVYSEDFVAENPNFTNFFDGLEGDDLNNGEIWYLEGRPSMTNATTSIKHSGNKSLFIKDNSATSDIFAKRILAPFSEADDNVSFWLYPKTLTNGFEFGLVSDGSSSPYNKRFWFRILPSGLLEYQTYFGANPCTAWQPLTAMPIAIGQWTKLNLNFNGVSSETDVYINGLNIGRIGACSSIGDISSLEFSALSLSGTGDLVYIDDIYTRQHAFFSQNILVGVEEGIYSVDNPWVMPISQNLDGVRNIYSFAETAVKNGGEIKYQFSNNGGNSWYWWNGLTWAVTIGGYEEANAASELNSSRFMRLPVGSGDIVFKAFLHSTGSQIVRLDNVEVRYMTSGGFRQFFPIAD